MCNASRHNGRLYTQNDTLKIEHPVGNFPDGSKHGPNNYRRGCSRTTFFHQKRSRAVGSRTYGFTKAPKMEGFPMNPFLVLWNPLFPPHPYLFLKPLHRPHQRKASFHHPIQHPNHLPFLRQQQHLALLAVG